MNNILFFLSVNSSIQLQISVKNLDSFDLEYNTIHSPVD